MTTTPLWSQDDEDFLIADLAKRDTLLVPALRAEITAERGTFIVLQQTISKLVALVENGEEITFKQVLNEEPAAWDAGQYPTAAIVAMLSSSAVVPGAIGPLTTNTAPKPISGRASQLRIRAIQSVASGDIGPV